MKTNLKLKLGGLLTALAIPAAALTAAPPAAYAGQPTINPAPATDYVDTTSCAFPVSVQFTTNDETAKVFTNGNVLFTGPLVADYSANGKTVSLNISGPGSTTIYNGTLIIGHGVSAGPLVTPNGVELAYVAGLVSISTSPTLQGVLEHGTVLLNICDALAP